MIYLTTDTHFDHNKLIDLGLRQVGDEYLIWEGLRYVPEKAWLIHLGDVSLGSDDKNHRDLIAICPAYHKILIRGNHDTRSFDWYLKRGWNAVCDGLVLVRYGKTILFSHRPRDLPEWIDVNIHGHCHLGNDERHDDKQHILLALETVGYKPVTLKEVLKMGGAR